MLHGLRIGRVKGIAVQAHWSLVVVGWLIAWSLATAALPDAAPDHSTVGYWIAGSIGSVVFLAGLLAHELAHALVAKRNHLEVQSITLWLLGGVAALGTQPPTAAIALRVSAAGPATSLGLAALASGGGAIAGAAGASELVVATFFWFATISAILAFFNLLPAFPLDGGRIYQALVWRRRGDPIAATERAAVLGRKIGMGLIAVGLLEAATLSVIGGLWLAMIGWFLREAASAEVLQGRTQRTLSAYLVRDVMTPNPVGVPADWSVAMFVEHLLTTGQHASYPVSDSFGRVVGLLSLTQIRALPSQRWSTTSLAELAMPRERVAKVSSTDPIDVLAQTLGDRAEMRALVFDDDRLVGIVAPSDLARLLIAIELVARAPLATASS